MDNRAAARIAIIGGGMGGASLALLLARHTTHDIVLIEQAALASDTLPDTPSYDARSTALALGSAEILDTLGAWRTLAPHAAPIRQISVSHAGHFGGAHLDAGTENVAALGFVAENRHLGHALLQALRATRVDVRAPARIGQMARRGTGWALTLAAGDATDSTGTKSAGTESSGAKSTETKSAVLDADLLVVADGVQSATRELLGVLVQEHDYEATALVCNVTPREAHHDVAHERFTPDGALALLPLTSQRCAVVWSLPKARARALLAADDDTFLAALAAAAGNRLGGFAKVGARSAYPLVKIIATEQALPGAVLLGNAAHLLHPVAGQGFNLTLRDAVVLADTLADAQARGEAPGELAVLQRYVARRARDQHLTAGLSHGLPALFTQDNPLVVAARAAGLLAFDLVAPLKREFARQAMGIGVFTGGTSRGN